MAVMMRGKAFCRMVENRLATTRSPFARPWSPFKHVPHKQIQPGIGNAVAFHVVPGHFNGHRVEVEGGGAGRPSSSAAMASTAVPQPMSVMLQSVPLRDLAKSQMKRRQADVVAWSPVPKAISAGTLRMRRLGKLLLQGFQLFGIRLFRDEQGIPDFQGEGAAPVLRRYPVLCLDFPDGPSEMFFQYKGILFRIAVNDNSDSFAPLICVMTAFGFPAMRSLQASSHLAADNLFQLQLMV